MEIPHKRILLTLFLGAMMQTLLSAEIDGTYQYRSLFGSLYIKGYEAYTYSYNYRTDRPGWNSIHEYDENFSEKHSYAFPPETILAAALGRSVIVKDKRIQTDLEDAQAEIVRVCLSDPRLKAVYRFSILSLPEFSRFRRADNGIRYARTRVPLMIEMLGARAIADYRAKIKGNRVVLKVSFRGNGIGYNLQGTAGMTAILK